MSDNNKDKPGFTKRFANKVGTTAALMTMPFLGSGCAPEEKNPYVRLGIASHEDPKHTAALLSHADTIIHPEGKSAEAIAEANQALSQARTGNSPQAIRGAIGKLQTPETDPAAEGRREEVVNTLEGALHRGSLLRNSENASKSGTNSR